MNIYIVDITNTFTNLYLTTEQILHIMETLLAVFLRNDADDIPDSNIEILFESSNKLKEVGISGNNGLQNEIQ